MVSWIIRDPQVQLRSALSAGRNALAAGGINGMRYAFYKVAQLVPWYDLKGADAILTECATAALDNQLDDLMAFVEVGRAVVAWRSGNLYDSDDHARNAAAIWSDTGHNLAAIPLLILGTNHARRGQFAEAKDILEKAAHAIRVSPQSLPASGITMAESLWIMPDNETLSELARDHLSRFDFGKMQANLAWPYWWALKLGIATSIAPLEGTVEQYLAEGRWEDAHHNWTREGAVYQAAIAESFGNTDAQLKSLATLDQMGALGLAGKIRARLRKAGVTKIPRGPRTSTADHAAGLTRRQSEVLDLLKTGSTNREIADTLFISIRTAENHVAAVLSRLGVADRSDLSV